jgi:hypothetical protein
MPSLPYQRKQNSWEEIEFLVSCAPTLRSALAGRRQIVLIAGEPGIGKTSLVDEFQRLVRVGATLRNSRGQCVEGLGGKEPFTQCSKLWERFAADREDSPLFKCWPRMLPRGWYSFRH